MTTFLYRVFDAEGRLLYVGLTDYPEGRIGGHRRKSRWFSSAKRIDWTPFSDRAEAVVAERRAIGTEAPRYNVANGGGFAGTSTFNMADRILSGQLAKRLQRARKDKVSYDDLARQFADEGISVSRETIRRWTNDVVEVMA